MKKIAAVLLGVFALGYFALGAFHYNHVLYPPVLPVVGEVIKADEKPTLEAPGVAVVHVLGDIITGMNHDWTPNDAYGYPTTVLLDNPQNFQKGEREAVRDVVNAIVRSLARTGGSSGADWRIECALNALNNDPLKWAFPDYGDKLTEAIGCLKAYETDLRSGKVRAYATASNLQEILLQVLNRLADDSEKLARAPTFSHADRITTYTAGDSAIEGEQRMRPSEYRTGWFEIDDNYYHTQGVLYVVHHVFRALLVDFREIIAVSKSGELGQQAVLEMDPYFFETSPFIVSNFDPLGFGPNHSLALNANVSAVRSYLVNFRDAAGGSKK